MQGLAPGADTFFYSIGDANPYDTSNEGFLAYLQIVNNQAHPPLVHSLSYGDIEADIFDLDNQAAFAYGQRCDVEFMKMGLRGMSVLVSSGDDGVGEQQGTMEDHHSYHHHHHHYHYDIHHRHVHVGNLNICNCHRFLYYSHPSPHRHPLYT